jgi:hypothetical protein
MRACFRDYRRDWQRWSRAERVAAVVLALAIVAFASAALVVEARAAHSQSPIAAWEQQS